MICSSSLLSFGLATIYYTCLLFYYVHLRFGRVEPGLVTGVFALFLPEYAQYTAVLICPKALARGSNQLTAAGFLQLLQKPLIGRNDNPLRNGNLVVRISHGLDQHGPPAEGRRN